MARHNLLAANLAHVDTPGYVPKDVMPGSFDGQLRVALETTDPAHLGRTGGAAPLRVIAAPGPGAGPDGNGVSIDREAAKVAANNVRYDAIATLVADELSSLSWAAADGRTG